MKTRDIVKEAVQKLGYKKLRKAQIQPINDLMDGKDILLIAPTSMGKSAVFRSPVWPERNKSQVAGYWSSNRPWL